MTAGEMRERLLAWLEAAIVDNDERADTWSMWGAGAFNVLRSLTRSVDRLPHAELCRLARETHNIQSTLARLRGEIR